MKKKGIVLSFIGILIIIAFILVIVNNKQKYIMQDGIMLALTLDGTSISEFPDGTNYRVEIDCANAKGMWLTEEWKLSVSDITGDVTCNLDFYTKSESDNLINIVESKATSTPTTLYTISYNENEKLSLEDYSNLSNDETNPFVFNSSTNVWETNTTEHSSMSFKLNTGFYKVCFKGDDPDDYMTTFEIYDDDWLNYLDFYTDSTMTDYKCNNFSEITEPTVFTVSYSGSSYVSNVSFYIQSLTEVITSEIVGDSGYRYNGINPNNYVWFNNEMWRIIGSIPTKLEDESTSNLVKIIREESISSIMPSISDWENNNIYYLLNDHYYADNIESLNANNSGYCYFYSNLIANCNYVNRGILSSSYYGNMVKNVYWNTGTSVTSNDVGESFVSESSVQNVQGKVGLITLSDYGYASISDNYYKNLGNSVINSNNWLFYGPEYTMTVSGNPNISSKYLFDIPVDDSYSSTSYSIRPVVYLDPSVYVVSGDGSITNPYQIAME